MKLTIFTDGGSRGNPGPAAYGFSILENEKEIAGIGKYIGIDTNNVAEYTAVTESLQWVLDHRELLGDLSGIDYFMDSELVCKQLNREYRVKHPIMQALFQTVQKRIEQLAVPLSFTHIRREKNKRADALVNLALDNL